MKRNLNVNKRPSRLFGTAFFENLLKAKLSSIRHSLRKQQNAQLQTLHQNLRHQ